jgi:hypothetical protein
MATARAPSENKCQARDVHYELHPNVEALAALIGSWSGRGYGEYPSIAPFVYEESVEFSHTGKPFIAYRQKTNDVEDGRPLHAEVGFLRVPGPGRIELVVAHPNGIAEVAEGSLDGGAIRLRSTSVASTGSAKEVTVIERDIDIAGPVIKYSLRMAAMGHPLGRHLSAELHRS